MDGFILRASLGDVDEVTRRLERKQTVNGKHSRLKYTALHAAADNGHLNVVQVLIAYGADVNAQRTFHLDTPLHFAAAGGHSHVVSFLLAHGAVRTMFDRVGRRPLDMALLYRRRECVELLGDLPDPVAKPVSVHATHTTMLLKWRYPFDDGVVVDNFEVRVVQLPDAFLPIAQAQEVADREAAEASTSTLQDETRSSRRGSIDKTPVGEMSAELDSLIPHVHSVGHVCEYLVTNSAPYTAFRVSVRAHTMVGWGNWGKWALVTTKSATPNAPPPATFIGNTLNSVHIEWGVPRDNGHPITGYKVDIFYLSPKECFELYNKATRKRARRLAAASASVEDSSAVEAVVGGSVDSLMSPLSTGPSTLTVQPSVDEDSDTCSDSGVDGPSDDSEVDELSSIATGSFMYDTGPPVSVPLRSLQPIDVWEVRAFVHRDLPFHPPSTVQPPLIPKSSDPLYDVDEHGVAHKKASIINTLPGTSVANTDTVDSTSGLLGSDAVSPNTMERVRRKSRKPVAPVAQKGRANTFTPLDSYYSLQGGNAGLPEDEFDAAASWYDSKAMPGDIAADSRLLDPTGRDSARLDAGSTSSLVFNKSLVLSKDASLPGGGSISEGEDETSDGDDAVLTGPLSTLKQSARRKKSMLKPSPLVTSFSSPALQSFDGEDDNGRPKRRSVPSSTSSLRSSQVAKTPKSPSKAGNVSWSPMRRNRSSLSTSVPPVVEAPMSKEERLYGRRWELAMDNIPASQTHLTIQFLNPGFGYRVRVYARNELGWGSASRPSPLFRLPNVPRQVLATRTSIVVRWSQPFLPYTGPKRKTELADIAGSGSDSESDYGLQHSLWTSAEAQFVYKLQYQVHTADVPDGCMIWRPYHKFRETDNAPHPSRRDVFPSQLIEQDGELSRAVTSAFMLRSPHPKDDVPDSGGDWVDVSLGSEGLARVATVEGLLPGTRYRFRMIYRPRHSRACKMGWMSWDEAPLSPWMQTDDDAPGIPSPPTAFPESKETAVLEWTAPRSNGTRITAYQIEWRRIHGNVHPDDSDSGLSNDEDIDLITKKSSDESVALDGYGGYRPGRWRRYAIPVMTSAALAAAAKLQKDRQKKARELAVKEGRAAEFLWGAAAVKATTGEDGEEEEEEEEEDESKQLTRRSSVSSKSLLLSSDAVGSPQHKRRSPIRKILTSEHSVIASTPKSLFQPFVSKSNPGKCGTALVWKVSSLRPGLRLQFRVRALNDIDWSEASLSTAVVKLPADVPYRPEPPLVTVASTKSLIVTWFLPRSCGARLKRIVVQRLKVRSGEHPDESDTDVGEMDTTDGMTKGTSFTKGTELSIDSLGMPRGTAGSVDGDDARSVTGSVDGGKSTTDDDTASVRSGFTGMSLGSITSTATGGQRQSSRRRERWRSVKLPDPMKRLEEIRSPREPIPYLSPEQLALVPPARHWQQFEVSGLYPGSVHTFRVKARNSKGWGEVSATATEVKVSPDVPMVPFDVVATPLSPFSMLVRWKSPHHNGSPLLYYHLQTCRMRFTDDEDDSDSDFERGPEGGDEVGRSQRLTAVMSGAPQPIRDRDPAVDPWVNIPVSEWIARRLGDKIPRLLNVVSAGNNGGKDDDDVESDLETPRLMYKLSPDMLDEVDVKQPKSVEELQALEMWALGFQHSLLTKGTVSTKRAGDAFGDESGAAGGSGGFVDEGDDEGVDEAMLKRRKRVELVVGPRIPLSHGKQLAWLVGDLRPGTWHTFRISAGNVVGESFGCTPTAFIRTFATEPDPPMPVSNPKSTGDSILCGWQLLRSNGSKITAFRLQRKRLRGRPHQDASASSDSNQEGDDEEEVLALEDIVPVYDRTDPNSQRIQDSLALCDLEAKLALDDEGGDADDETDPVTVSSRNRRSPRPITSLSVRAKRKEKWALVATDLPVIGAAHTFRTEGSMITPEAQDVIEQHMPVTHGTSGKAMAWWIRDLVPGTQHNVRVQVKNGIGWSKPSYIWWTANTKAMVPETPEPPVVYMTSSYTLHMMVRRPHDYGSRVIGYEIQARRLRKRKRGRGGETPSLALPLSGGATPAPEAQIVVRSPSPNARQAAQQLRVSVGAGGPVQPPLQSPVAITAHRPSVALIPATPAHGTVRATPVQFKGGPTPLPSPTRKGPSMASIPPVDLVSAGGSSVLAADDGGDDSDSNVLGPSPTEAESGGWKRDAWVTIGRFDRKDCAIPPVASLQYMFDVPLPSTTPAWAMAVLPDHRDAVHCEPRDWVGHPAIGTHPGVTGYVPSLDPKVSYMSCQGVLPRCVSQFRVRALNGIGWSEYSEPTTAIRTTRTAPQPPGQVKLKGRADNLLSLYWAPARPNGYPVTRYQLECRLHDPLDVTDIPTSRYKPKPETLWTLIRDDLIDTYCLVPGLRYGCGYVFRVKAENKVGWSLWSDDSEIIKTSRLLT